LVNFIPVSIDVEIGALLEEQVCAQESARLMDSLKANSKVTATKQIFEKLTQSGMLNHHTDFNWTIHFIQDDSTVNAFCLPGGHIFVYSGLLNLTANEAEIAGVLGHEIAHAELRHSLEQLIQQYGLQLIAENLLGINGSWFGVGLQLAQLKFSRSDEEAADIYAYHLLQFNQIDTDALVSFFKKMDQSKPSQISAFLSTHPDTEKRIQTIQALNQSENSPKSN
jgi:predicted Zn-dependent protease